MIKRINAHAHIEYNDSNIEVISEIFKGIMEHFEYDKLHFLSLSFDGDKTDEAQNLKCIYLKEKLSGYGSASLVHHFDERDTRENFARQARLYHEMGFDGYKMLEGKPNVRKPVNFPLDSPVYWSLYEYAEGNGLPVVMHVADPDRFWDVDSASEYYRKKGWVYDETFPSKEKLFDEVFRIMKNFPKLKLTLAHMGFMANEKERICDFLEKWENTAFDLVINHEIKGYITDDFKWWSDFFEKHKTRFMFGSDLYPFDKGDYTYYERFPRDVSLREFVEGKMEFELPDGTKKTGGLSLSGERLERILYKNHEERYGKPRALDYELVLKMCDDLQMEEKYAEDVKIIRKFFEERL